MSCYEAGRDGFWLHRYLVEAGVENLVVDSSSIQVDRRFRRAKTDRMDVAKLVDLLMRYERGEKKVWRVVRVPGVEAEDRRHLHRELEDLKAERTQHINRMKGLLVGQGVRLEEIGSGFPDQLNAIRLWDGQPIPEGLKARLQKEYERLQFIQGQIHELEAERVEAIRRSEEPRGGEGAAAAAAEGDRAEQCLGGYDGVLCLAGLPQRQRSGRVGGTGADALPERGELARARDEQSGEPARESAGDRDCVGVAALPAGE